MLEGRAGRDLLISGAGDDVLSGEGGADVFRFTERHGFEDDRIVDFHHREVIQLLIGDDVHGFEDFTFLRKQLVLENGCLRIDTVVELEGGSITLESFGAALRASNFDLFG